MCGIAGIVQVVDRALDARSLETMTQTLAHRGPDGEGYVLLGQRNNTKPLAVSGRLSDSVRGTSHGYTVGFGHRRLAILDLSPLGHQPMGTEDGRFWITYNGEVYNYVELRQELQALGWTFRSQTDTEVVLSAYVQWGPACLERFNGMFAFAIWDGTSRRLFCARDRVGMKPFYYKAGRDRFRFASEIKALLDGDEAPNDPIIYDFLTLGLQDHSEYTFFGGIRQLRPGTYLWLEGDRVSIHQWWTLTPLGRDPEQSEEDATRAFSELFTDAVRLHLRSDVPVGSCLSGGLDSSSIVCTAQRLLDADERREHLPGAGPRLRTFSSCFEDPACDERRFLRTVVAQADVESIEIFPDGRRLFADMPQVLWFQDEPFGGTSYLAQWEIMRAASRHGVTVLLDGQGGDELLCGYPGYWGSLFGDLLREGRISTCVAQAWRYRRGQARIHPTVFANLARATLPTGVVAWARTGLKRHQAWLAPEFAARYAERNEAIAYAGDYPTALQNHQAAYLRTHSLPALLHHEDRNSMAFSLEARLPFLDARLVDFLMQVPGAWKLKDGRSKNILRRGLADVLPDAVKARTDKMGFVTPEDRWLRETLRPECEELFASRSFAHRGYWDPVRVRRAYREYCEGQNQMGASVWRWICLELWFQRFFA